MEYEWILIQKEVLSIGRLRLANLEQEKKEKQKKHVLYQH